MKAEYTLTLKVTREINKAEQARFIIKKEQKKRDIRDLRDIRDKKDLKNEGKKMNRRCNF